jgi:hypothetical protein
MTPQELTAWETHLLALDRYENEQDGAEFLKQVQSVKSAVDLPVAKALMKTFVDADDYGIQERVSTVLNTAPEPVRFQALIDDMPRLVRQGSGKEWPLLLLGDVFSYGDPDVFFYLYARSDELSRQAVRTVLESEEFQEEYPDVKQYLDQL